MASVRERLEQLEKEIENIRGPLPIPSERPVPLPPEYTRALLSMLAEASVHYVTLGELERARRLMGDAIALADEVHDPVAVARASLLMGEAMLEMDSPLHARARLEIAVRTYDKLADPKLAARARGSLGRAMLLLEDPAGEAILAEAHEALTMLGDNLAVARIDAILDELHGGGDVARVIRAGYGRGVSMIPSAMPPAKR